MRNRIQRIGGLVAFVALFTVLLWPILSLGFLFAFAVVAMPGLRSLDDGASYSSPILIRQAGRDVLVCWTGLFAIPAVHPEVDTTAGTAAGTSADPESRALSACSAAPPA